MRIQVLSRRRSLEKLQASFPDATIIDLTSKAATPWVRFSPFYPHGGIPIPFSEGIFGESVEGIWQGLKVIEGHGIDPARFQVRSMKGLKRTVRKYGPVKGHQKGLHHPDLLSYREARYQIYLPCYQFVLENRLQEELAELRQMGPHLIFLDYETNTELNNLSRPLSHAGLVREYLLP